jgi:hypothetical protein
MRRTHIQLVFCSALLFVAGCDNKKLKEPMALAKLPDLAYPVVLPPPPEPAAASDIPSTIPPEPKPATRTVKPRPRPRPTKPSDTPVASQPPSKETTTPTTPDTGTTISAGIPHSVEQGHRQSTSELIQLTEDNLRSLNRQLTSQEQSQVEQIRNFIAQSRSATSDNDLVRAHNLAMKAHLLSDELVRH